MVNLLNTTAFEKALDAFHRSINVSAPYLSDTNTSPDLKQTLQAGVIQHFEFCYELCWNMIKRQLEIESITPSSIDALSYPELIREGVEKQLICDAKKWLLYRHQRNITSHTYNQDKAESVYNTALEFYNDANALLAVLKSKNS